MIGGRKGDLPEADGTPQPAGARDVTLHRVRVGVTGLAVVFLLTVLAASIFSLLGQDDRGTTRLANGAVVANGALPAEAPKEPLAELGVAPGNMPPGNVAMPVPPARHAASGATSPHK
jgi:hypothetical protein